MATKAGVWIDHKQAIVVLITDAGQEIKKVKSSGEKPIRPAGATSSLTKHTPNDFVAEKRLERKLVAARKNVYEEVLDCIQGADALLVIGPGEAKGEFIKHMKAKKVRGVVVETETADKMTDNQLAAKVKKHFATSSGKKTVAPKRTAKKAAKATAGKRLKKSGK